MAMMKRLGRRALRQVGISLPYGDVICPATVKSVIIGTEPRTQITVRQTLVFLDTPDAGDLFDVCAVDPQTTFEKFIIQSHDSSEIGRRRLGRRAIVVDWTPKSRITPYALYDHEYSWSIAGSQAEPAVFAEFETDLRTGTFMLEMITPQTFEAAVVFERPRWPPVNTERRLVKYALKKMEEGAERPILTDNGQRLEWKSVGPARGVRYVCVAFHQHGLIVWRDRLKKASWVGGLRQLIGRPS